jgi:DNA-binding GntR family transcriptional regulator
MAKEQTTSEATYSAIRSRILLGHYPADAHLTEIDLARELDVSRTPVREALRRLTAEGLVSLSPNRGVTVIGWSDDEIEEIFELRALLESFGARLAASKVSKSDLDRLRRLVDEMDELHKDTGRPERFEQIALLNNAFHLGILQVSGKQSFVSVLSSLLHVPLVARTFIRYSPEDLHRSANHHHELLSALGAGDGLWAESVMRSHILAARSVLTTNFRDAASSPTELDGSERDT